jgi:hypothetical protein
LTKKKPQLNEAFAKRLKGLEPSTFCMARVKIDLVFPWLWEIPFVYRAFWTSESAQFGSGGGSGVVAAS